MKLDLVTALTTVATIIINQNKNEMIFMMRTIYTTHTQDHVIAAGIDRYDRIGSIGVGLNEFNDIRCIFNGNIHGNGFDNDTTFGMFVFIFFFFSSSFYLIILARCFFVLFFHHVGMASTVSNAIRRVFGDILEINPLC